MDNYVAVVFGTDAPAFDALHALWSLDADGTVTVHGAAVVHRDGLGHIDVAAKQTDPGLRTALGIGIGALLGALAGPVGAAYGAKIGAGAAGIGAAAGGVTGLTADTIKSQEHGEAVHQAGFVLQRGQSAVIAEISEDWTEPVDAAMARLGGRVYRRPKDEVRKDSFGDYFFGRYLYPYDDDPTFP